MCNDVGYEVEEVGQTGRMRREKDRKKRQTHGGRGGVKERKTENRGRIGLKRGKEKNKQGGRLDRKWVWPGSERLGGEKVVGSSCKDESRSEKTLDAQGGGGGFAPPPVRSEAVPRRVAAADPGSLSYRITLRAASAEVHGSLSVKHGRCAAA